MTSKQNMLPLYANDRRPTTSSATHRNTAMPPPQSTTTETTYFDGDRYMLLEGAGPTKDEHRILKIFRVVVVILLFAFILMSFSKITLLINKPSLPKVRLDWITVTQFHVSENRLAGQWEANITMENPDTRFKVSFHLTMVEVYYKQIFLTDSQDQQVMLKPKENATLNHKMRMSLEKTDNTDLPFDEITRARRSGTVSFQVRVPATVFAMHKTWWQNRVDPVFVCGDVPFRFNSAAVPNAATFEGGNKGKNCPLQLQ